MPTVMAYATGLIKNNAQFTQFNVGAEYTVLGDGQAVWTGKVSSHMFSVDVVKC